MKIYTKKGDEGKTDLFGGERVLKSDEQVQAYAALDGANTAIGMVLSEAPTKKTHDKLVKVMKLMFCAGSEIATSQKASAQESLHRKLHERITHEHVLEMEGWIDAFEEALPPLTSFILPSGCKAASKLHFSRTMVRQAEIKLVELTQREGFFLTNPEILKFLNRLSDFLFVLARYENLKAGVSEIAWSGKLNC